MKENKHQVIETAENSKVASEYRRLATNMKVPLVDENL